MFTKNNIIMISCLFLAIICTNNIISVNSADSNPITLLNAEPVTEVWQLNQNGSTSSPYILNFTLNFEIVTKLIIFLDFYTNTLDLNKFGDDTALTNGINITYDDIALLGVNQTIKSNADFKKYFVLTDPYQDQQTPKNWIIAPIWDFTSDYSSGLQITSTNSFHIIIQDDIASLTPIQHFSATIKGFSYNLSINSLADNTIQKVHTIHPDPANWLKEAFQVLYVVGPYAFFDACIIVVLILILRSYVID